MRGNPWANAGSQWAPPPKPPGANRRPPPSAGAARYGKFETPRASAHPTEGAEARKKTYEAWESMRGHDTRSQANRESYKPTPPRRDYTNTSGRDESNSYKHPPPPKPKPGYDEYRANYSPNASPHRRAQSTGASHRKGFTPATPGGDEPAAPKGAYFTQHKSQYAPEPPPRAPATSSHNVQPDAPRQNVQPDPLRQFREQVNPTGYDSRQRTPYQTHGGEKLNPFDNANLNRSKSHRERPEKTSESPRMPRTGSDPNLSQPHRARSFADHPPNPSAASFAEEGRQSSSSDDGPKIKNPNSRKFAQPRRVPTGSSKDRMRMPDAAAHSRKPSLSQFQNWYRDNPTAEAPLNEFPSDEPATSSGQPNTRPTATEESNMYGAPQSHSSSPRPATASNRSGKYSVSEVFDFTTIDDDFSPWNKRHFVRNKAASSIVTPPSGVAADGLNLFEAHQHRLVDELISKRQASGSKLKYSCEIDQSRSDDLLNDYGLCAQGPAPMGSPSKRQKFHLPPSTPYAHHHTQYFPVYTGQQKSNANDINHPSSFSFKVDDNTFATTNSRPNGVASPSTENINTKFTPEEWEGKFEAGQDYFRPEQKAAGVPPRGRTQSASRSRGRSPIKIRPIDPKGMQPQVPEDTPIESPGGTKFTPEQWAQTFKTQTFMPPPPAMPARHASSRKGRGPSIRQTMGGNAAVVDDSDNSSDEVPFFIGRRNQQPPVVDSPALDPMEVDSTPPSEPAAAQPPKTPTSNTVPVGMPSPSKRAAGPSQSPVDAALKVDFDDLKVQDLISTINLPVAPTPPTPPVNFTPQSTRPKKEAYDVYLNDFKTYMHDWDLFTNQFAFHILTRKKWNDNVASMRWEDEKGLAEYRKGLKEDQFVLKHWAMMLEKHEGVLKDYTVWKERMKPREERPRKKTH